MTKITPEDLKVREEYRGYVIEGEPSDLYNRFSKDAERAEKSGDEEAARILKKMKNDYAGGWTMDIVSGWGKQKIKKKVLEEILDGPCSVTGGVHFDNMHAWDHMGERHLTKRKMIKICKWAIDVVEDKNLEIEPPDGYHVNVFALMTGLDASNKYFGLDKERDK